MAYTKVVVQTSDFDAGQESAALLAGDTADGALVTFTGLVIVLVVVASPHRAAAFEAAEFMMDWLKTEAPFWKKEYLTDGTAQWVDARETDEKAKDRWNHVDHA